MKEMDAAGRDMQKTANEMEETSLMLQRDLPPALEALEDAAREFEELGEAMGSVLGPFAGNAARGRTKRGVARRQAASGEESSDPEARQAAKEMTDELATAVRPCRHAIANTSWLPRKETLATLMLAHRSTAHRFCIVRCACQLKRTLFITCR